MSGANGALLRRPPAKGPWKFNPEITSLDDEILRWIAKRGVVQAEQIGWRFFWRPDSPDKGYGKSATARRLDALSRLRLILRYRNPYAGIGSERRQDLVCVSRRGALRADLGIGPATIVLHELRHSLAVVNLTEALLDEYPGSELTTERELRAERYRERWAGVLGSKRGRIPDALLLVPTEDAPTKETVAIELDLSRKDSLAMEDMVRAYDRVKVDEVWWYVTKERMDRTRQLVRQMKADNRMEVRAWLG